jgi:FeS assembly protein IscX
LLSANSYFLERTMPKELTWDDADDIGILLSDTHPDINPLEIRFTDLHRYVTELPTFKDDPKKSNEAKLEAIQMAWHEEFLDRTQG